MNSLTSSNAYRDPYATLGIERSAGAGEVKRAYFRLVREFPPEQQPEKFQEIRAAYEQVRTAKARARTDLFLLQPPPTLPNRRRPVYALDVGREELAALAREIALAQQTASKGK